MTAQELMDLLEELDGYGIVYTDEELIKERLIRLGYKDEEVEHEVD